jgi:hypothetical protein
MIGDEFQTPKVNNFTKGEANASIVLVVGDDSEFW